MYDIGVLFTSEKVGFFFQAEDGRRDAQESRGLGDVYKRQDKGFDSMDRKLLDTIIDKFSGGPVGIDSLAASLSEDKETLEDVYEPYLIQKGYIQRTTRGRMATPLAYEYLKKNSKQREDTLF